MASAYPGALDALTNPSGSDSLDTPAVLHSAQHTNANDAVEAIEATLGVNPQGGSATVKARLDALTAATKTTRLPYTWTISTPAVASGDTDFIMGFMVPVPAGQTVKLVATRHVINSGTSVGFKFVNNGTDVTGFTALSSTTTAATTNPADITLADGDYLRIVVNSVTGTPKNWVVSAWLEYTV